MKNLCSLVTWIVVVAGTLMLCKSAGFLSGLLFAPFVFWPLLVQLRFRQSWRSRAADWLLATAAFLFGVWFIYIYRGVFVWDNGPHESLFWVGVRSLPFLGFAWLFAYMVRGKPRRIRSSSRSEPLARTEIS